MMAKIGRRRMTEQQKEFNAMLGGKICAARKAKGMTQAELAVALDIGYKQLYWYESGRSAIPLNLVAPLCRILGLPVAIFIHHGTYCG